MPTRKNMYVPDYLQERGRKLWQDVLETYELSKHEQAVLLEACNTVDLIDKMRRALKRDGMTSKGSMGQLVVHPFVAEIRQQRALLDRLIKSLNLPDIEEEAETGGESGLRLVPEPNQHRAAAQSKWGKAYG